MKEITIEEKKRISLEILDVIHDFCEENGIKYYLSYGTLLGAVRHKGFIPWDDDIDLVMLRPEYELFQKLFNVDGYTFVNEETKNIFPLVFGKVFANNTFGVFNGISMKIKDIIFEEFFKKEENKEKVKLLDETLFFESTKKIMNSICSNIEMILHYKDITYNSNSIIYFNCEDVLNSSKNCCLWFDKFIGSVERLAKNKIIEHFLEIKFLVFLQLQGGKSRPDVL